MDVIVIGGGAAGTNAAWRLAERGVDVRLLERGSSVGAGTTPRAAGGMRTFYSTPAHVELSRAADEVWRSFEDEYGFDVDYTNPGYLFVARTRTEYEHLRKDVVMQNAMIDVETEFLSPEEATAHLPKLKTENYRGAAWHPIGKVADPHMALQAFATLAREAGAQVLTDHRVTDLLQDGNGRVTGVKVNDGESELTADYVVNAAGPWGHRIAAMAGVEIPITPKKRHAGMVIPDEPLPENCTTLVDLHTGFYFGRQHEEMVVVGGHFEEADPDVDPDDPGSYRDSVDLDWAASAMEAATTTSEYFGEGTEFVRGWSGVYAITNSNHPIVEESVPGLINDVGHSGRGFMQSPATGRVVADLVLEGETDVVDRTALQTDDGVDRRGQLPIPYRADMYE